MSNSLQKRIRALVRQVLDSYPGAWMVWCDLRGDWAPLLQRVANDTRMGGFRLVQINDWTAGELGGPLARAELQQRLEAHESFVLLVPAALDNLGWLWAQTLLAECIYTRSLREQLLDWGWRSHSLTISDDEVAVLARQYLQQDPTDWGGGGLQPDIPLLLEVLAGGAEPQPDNRMILDLTIEQAGLPVRDEQQVSRWRSRSLARLLVTQAFQAAPKLVGEGHELLIPAERWRIALPRGASSFRAYGGLGYFHGGASLQEWIIPCVQIEWPLQARPVAVEIQPLAHILTQRPRVTLLVVRSSLLIEDAIPHQVEVVIRDARQHTILFRSAPTQMTPDQDQVTVAVPVEEGRTAARGTPLRIEVRDRRTEEVIATRDSTLMTELTGW